MLANGPAIAQTLPGAVDAGRIDDRTILQTPPQNVLTPAAPMRVLPSAEAPEGSKEITMTLRAVRIEGMTAFTTAQVEDIYASQVGHTITLDTAWTMAGQLTERYRNAGYFLSRASVPEQEITDGVIRLYVVEGYIGEVQLDDPMKDRAIVKTWLDRLQAYRPLKAEQIESVLLQLNDLPGVHLRAVLEPLPRDDYPEGAVRLILKKEKAPRVTGQVSFDNNGSRFLGPYQGMAQAQAELIPTQRTTATLLSSLPWDELKYGGIKHEVPVMAAGMLDVYATRTAAEPGSSLAIQDIESDSLLLGVGFHYQFIRQRQENLSGRLAFESRNTDSDILGTPLTRDAIRALRAGMNYETLDAWGGYDFLSATVSQGVGILGASKAGQANLSRAEAEPDFTKLEARLTRTQALTSDWAMVVGASMQVASGPLYSAEEFGYGGQSFGRAYDESEITGDHGVAATAELRFTGWKPQWGFLPVPYAFYDVGSVWNEDREQEARASGSSAGAGLRVVSEMGVQTNFGIAFPLTRDVSKPLYGNDKSPRYLMQVSYGF
jgi:hemolysin activation/secretion protein